MGFTKECGVRNLFLIFAQSRMSVVQESNRKADRSGGLLTQLPYEGFLECIVRLALLKALPTDKEMQKKDFQVPRSTLGTCTWEGGGTASPQARCGRVGVPRRARAVIARAL